MNATPSMASAVFGFVIVRVSVDAWFTPTTAGVNALAMNGGAGLVTLSVWLAVVPVVVVPALVVVIAVVVLT